MNAPATIDKPSTEIATIVSQTPVVVLTDEKQREAFYAHIEREVEAFEPDTGTPKGRDAIKSFAYKITRTKTAIDDAGKKLNEDARARINAVDAERRAARERLTALAEQVRQPLTEWEEAEKERVAWCQQVIADFKRGAVVTMDDTAQSVRERGKAAWEVIIKPETFGDLLDEAQAAKDTAVVALKAALARLTQEEADRAELERLRAEAAEREAREQAEREAREAEERAAAEAKAAEERRAAAEKAEAERIERAAKEAAEKAQREADRKAREEQAERDREHAEQLAAERRRTEEAEAAAKAERDRIAAEEAKRDAEAKRLADEQAARDANQAHRRKVKAAAKDAIIACGADEDTARKIVISILAGEIPNVTLRF